MIKPVAFSAVFPFLRTCLLNTYSIPDAVSSVMRGVPYRVPEHSERGVLTSHGNARLDIGVSTRQEKWRIKRCECRCVFIQLSNGIIMIVIIHIVVITIIITTIIIVTIQWHSQKFSAGGDPVWGWGIPLSPLSIYFLIFSPFYFSFSFIGFTYFFLLSIPSYSTRIVPLFPGQRS